jgi:hypothetical protein
MESQGAGDLAPRGLRAIEFCDPFTDPTIHSTDLEPVRRPPLLEKPAVATFAEYLFELGKHLSENAGGGRSQFVVLGKRSK